MLKLSRTFWIATPLALIAIGLGAFIYTSGRDLTQNFERERTTPLTTFQCDLSSSGEYDIPVHVNYSGGHGLKVLVVGPPQTPGRYELEPWLNDLKGSVTTISGPFGPHEPMDLSYQYSFASGPDSRGIVRVPDSSKGDHVLHLSITHGAPALIGVPHQLVIYNDVCGCELLAVFYGNIIALALAIAGLVSAIIAIAFRKPAATI